MSTWTLWRLVRYPPPYHPLTYRRNTAQRRRQWKLVLPFVLVGGVLLVCAAPVLLILAVGFIAITPITIPLIVAIFVLEWVINISTAIGRQRERGTYDLLCLLPPGALGVSWLIAMAGLRRTNAFSQLWAIVQVLTVIGLAILMVMFLATLPLNAPGATRFPEGTALQYLLLLDAIGTMLLFYADFIQSVCLSVSIVLFAATRAATRTDARVLSVSLFLLVQVAVYLCTVVIGYALLPTIFANLALSGTVPQLALVVLRFALLCGLREIAVILLWRQIALDYGEVEVSQLVRDMTPGAVLAPIEPAARL